MTQCDLPKLRLGRTDVDIIRNPMNTKTYVHKLFLTRSGLPRFAVVPGHLILAVIRAGMEALFPPSPALVY